MTERKLRLLSLKDVVIIIWICPFFSPLFAGPIDEDPSVVRELIYEQPGMPGVQQVCSRERILIYSKLVKDLMITKYLASNVRRCNKISNCNQAKVVVMFTTKGGSQSIMECPEQLPTFFLFTGLDCHDYIDTTLRSVLNNETIVNCRAASKVRNRLFNKKNCAWNTQEPSEKELINWSFDMLDANFDRQLIRDEFGILTNIPDQECGESFFRNCDTDMDGYIREDEWSEYLCPDCYSSEYLCPDCYNPCLVYQSKKLANAEGRRYVQPIVTCELDGTCASKQCEKMWALHEICWCVDSQCNEIEGTKSYAAIDCNSHR